MDWIMDNWIVLIPIIISLASVIVKATPNTTDNQWLEKFIKVFEVLSLNTPPVKKK
jgi:hypothetical protein